MADYCLMVFKTSKTLSKGFTLVEIMIVVMILGLLLAIVVPHYVRQRATAQANTCINNLTKIESAASQFALERGKKTGDPLSYPQDLSAYLRLNSSGNIPPCPSGGTYVLANVGNAPTCSLGSSVSPAHILP